MSYKLGSLFDGSGGFPLSGSLCGIEPVWAAEVEPYPIAVTSSRFPKMKHLGDISKVNGAEIEPVDIITFGSPCQDLSVAGKRAGLKHEDNGDDETTRSGLFMEAVRIIKEMRGATNGEYPRFACWENVPGAFSSNNGEDFRIVLQELIKIAEPYAVMPEVPKKGWAYADCFCGDGWSLAYRVFDAQYWGVPQRRRRIYLVADFRGGCAEKILFEREGLRGYFTQGGAQRQIVAPDAERGIGADDSKGAICYGISSYDSNAMKSDNPHSGVYEADTARTLDLNGGNPACNQGGIAVVQGVDVYNQALTGEIACTLTAEGHTSTGSCPKVMIPIAVATQQGGAEITENGVCPTITAAAGMSGNNQPWICQGLDSYNQVLTGDKAKTLNSAASDADHVPCAVYSVENHPADSRVDLDESGKVQTLTSRMGTGGGNVPMVMEPAVYEWHNQDSRINGPIGVACTLNTNAGGREGHLVMEPFCKSRRAKTADDATTWKHADVANTLNVFDQGEVRANELVVFAVDQGGGKSACKVTEEQAPTLTCTHDGAPVVAHPDCVSFNWQAAPGAGLCVEDDIVNPLACTRTPAIAYGFDPGASRDVGALFIEECGKTLTNGTCPGHHDGVVISHPCHTITTGSFTQIEEEKSPTLMARDYKDPTCVEFFDAKERRYIVRRLTPTECARLQGFPDNWGHIEPKTELTEDEYKFWLEVRKTHDAINGKAVKDYNEKQMLTYYNKLWNDSAEYKMWGNGIALCCALYVMQGIKDALVTEQTARRKWLDELLGGI